MVTRILAMLAVLIAALIGLAFTWPQLFGLQDQWVVSHAVALRGTGVVVAVIGAAAFGLLALARRGRVLSLGMVVVLLLFAVANSTVLAIRGISGLPASEAPDQLVVLSWNTLGEVPDADSIARIALDQRADIIALPETTASVGEEIAIAMRQSGSPMWVKTIAFDEIAKARSTTLLISPELGDYEVTSVAGTGPPGNTNTLPTVVAVPTNGDGPKIVAVHAVAPIRWEMRNWRSDLAWLAEQCDDADVIMAGDFNATVDHFTGHGIDGGDFGRCHDAALAAGAAAIGTWPTAVPPLLGSPIDHVLVTGNWEVDSFEVLTEHDHSGSDHRPIVARLVER